MAHSWPGGHEVPRWTTEDLLKCLPLWGRRQHGITVSNLAEALGEDNTKPVRERLFSLELERLVVRRYMGNDSPLHWRK